MILSHIVAITKNFVIGKDNTLPWSLPADMKYFKETTKDHFVIMGRKNYEVEGQPLHDRTNIIITTNNNYIAPGCVVTNSILSAIKIAESQNEKEVFVIGGGEIYRQTIDMIDRLYITIIDTVIDGDIYYPQIDFEQWKLLSKRFYKKDELNKYDHTYFVYEKIK